MVTGHASDHTAEIPMGLAMSDGFVGADMAAPRFGKEAAIPLKGDEPVNRATRARALNRRKRKGKDNRVTQGSVALEPEVEFNVRQSKDDRLNHWRQATR